ncbi:hypothetical protein, partial [Shewanella algae]|uniref:hypothetical protein n=1 Tax=Shewanella algae TaxID=38313 RepID=UPI00313B1FB7
NGFGTYFYYALADFIQNKNPGSYEREIYTQKTNHLTYTRAAIFLQSEKRFNNNWQVHTGIRIIVENIAGSPKPYRSFNEHILPKIAAVYNI